MASSQRPADGAQSDEEKATDKNGMDTYTNSSPTVEQGRKATSDGVPTQEDWRDLALLIQKENDPQRMIELVQQLISRFDEEKLRKVLQTRTDAK